MTATNVDVTLEAPASSADWQAFHDIREAVLFAGRGRAGVYDRSHPDDTAASNLPLLLKVEGKPAGTIRLDDLGDGTGAIRLVAISPSLRGKGYGRLMAEECDARARVLGLHTLFVNSAPEAVGFYESLGWEHHEWSREERTGIASGCIQMRKRL